MTEKENLKDTLSWMQRKLAAADKNLTKAQFLNDYNAAENLRKNMRRWRTAIKAVKRVLNPVRLNRDKWESCFLCDGAEYIDGEAKSSNGSCMYAPFDICPWCGRPLTEEGWKMLENICRNGRT